MENQPSKPALQPGDLIAANEAAALLGLRPQTLSNWRTSGQGPKFVRVGSRAIRYRRADIDAFIQGGQAEVAA